MTAKTRENAKKEAAELAVTAFANHALTVEQGEGVARCWLCRNPKKSEYWFRVVMAPRTLIVIGDLGEWLFTISDDDPLPWIRGACRSTSYLYEKLRPHQDEFYPGDAMDLIKENRRDGSISADDARVIFEGWTAYGDNDGPGFERAWYEVTADTESLSSVHGPPFQFYLVCQALERFSELEKQSHEKQAA